MPGIQTQAVQPLICRVCNEPINGEVMHINGLAVCVDCYNEQTAACQICGHIDFNSNFQRDGLGRRLCRDCLDRLLRCQQCQRLFPSYLCAEVNGSYICSYCLNRYYWWCDTCNDYHITGSNCPQAQGEAQTELYEYGYEPDYRFYSLPEEGKDKGRRLFIGIELETEICNDNSTAYYLRQISDNPYVYAKYDGSLHDGIEFVSMPCTFDYLKKHFDEVWGKVLNLRRKGLSSYNTSTCGLHISLSKSAFSPLQIYKWLLFFLYNKDFIVQLSQRNGDNLEEWARIEDCILGFVDRAKGNTRGNDRYVAINLKNKDRIEIRIFKGTLNPKGVWRAIEFCHALYEFTNMVSYNKQSLSVWRFAEFVEAKQKTYKNLYSWFIKKGYLQLEI